MNELTNIDSSCIPKRRGLLRATSLVSCMTLISRFTGFARDMILAHMFGAEAGMDAFLVAFRIPNFMRRLFAEGAFSQAFVPVLAEYQTKKTFAEVQIFLSRIAGLLGFILSIITWLGILIAPLIVIVFAPGFGLHSERMVLATHMLRWTFPYLMFISLTAMAGAVLNTYGYFAIPAITPVLLNLCLIIGAIYISPVIYTPIIALAWAVFAAGLLQLLFQLPFLYRKNLLVSPRLTLRDSGVKSVLTLMLPALMGVSIAQLNLLIDTLFASFLKVGSVTWLFFSDRLTDFPLGVFGVAIATVILPHLSRTRATENKAHFSESLDWGIRLLLLIGIPSSIGLSIFAIPLISSCFGYGQFNAVDILQTQKSLFTLALGVPAFMLVKILASGFYAHQDIKTPVKIGMFAMIVNTICCAALIMPLKHAGLTLATSISGFTNAFLLAYILIRRNLYLPKAGWIKYIMQLFFANSMLLTYLLWVRADITFWLSQGALSRILFLGFYVSIGCIIYIISLLLTGVRVANFRLRA